MVNNILSKMSITIVHKYLIVIWNFSDGWRGPSKAEARGLACYHVKTMTWSVFVWQENKQNDYESLKPP